MPLIPFSGRQSLETAGGSLVGGPGSQVTSCGGARQLTAGPVEEDMGWQELGKGADPKPGGLGVGQAQDWQGVGVQFGKRKTDTPL